MKQDACLLNFGRGALIVDADLIEAVTAKTIAGAVLDVFAPSPCPPSIPFWMTPGITVLPHIGGGHPDAQSTSWPSSSPTTCAAFSPASP